MNLFGDLKSDRAILTKGWLFLGLALLSTGELLALTFRWDVLILFLIAAWSWCRWYYFAFYVIEKYVDPNFRFAGLLSVAGYSRERSKRI